MNLKLNKFLLVVILILFYGCSTDPKIARTTGKVVENLTMYTANLECLGELIRTNEPEINKYTAAIGKIQDKTGERKGVGSPLTQAASEMALTAFTKINAFELLSPIDRSDLTHINIPTPTDNIGSILKSHFHLDGVISEYNEDIEGYNGGLDFFRKYLDFGFSGTEKILSVAMDLRLVGSKTGKILRNGQNELLAVSLKNSVHTKEFGGVLMRIFNVSMKNGAVADYVLKISDPKDLAIREIIEQAAFELIGKLYEIPFEQCTLSTPFQEENIIGGSIAQYMDQKDQGYAQQVLEHIPTKDIVEWKTSGLEYTMLATETYEKEDKTACREYYISILKQDNRKEASQGTACRQANGIWKDV